MPASVLAAMTFLEDAREANIGVIHRFQPALVLRRCQCSARVPAREAPPRGRPARRSGLRAPDKALPAGCWLAAASQLSHRLLLPRAKRQGLGGNSRQLQLGEPELQLQPRAARRPPPSASDCEANLPSRPPLSMPSAAVGRDRAPWPGPEGCGWGPGTRPRLPGPAGGVKKGRAPPGTRAPEQSREKPVSVRGLRSNSR
ncbi:uncharacterized protein ACIGJ3_014729 [Trichechus inunguis]